MTNPDAAFSQQELKQLRAMMHELSALGEVPHSHHAIRKQTQLQIHDAIHNATALTAAQHSGDHATAVAVAQLIEGRQPLLEERHARREELLRLAQAQCAQHASTSLTVQQTARDQRAIAKLSRERDSLREAVSGLEQKVARKIEVIDDLSQALLGLLTPLAQGKRIGSEAISAAQTALGRVKSHQIFLGDKHRQIRRELIALEHHQAPLGYPMLRSVNRIALILGVKLEKLSTWKGKPVVLERRAKAAPAPRPTPTHPGP